MSVLLETKEQIKSLHLDFAEGRYAFVFNADMWPWK